MVVPITMVSGKKSVERHSQEAHQLLLVSSLFEATPTLYELEHGTVSSSTYHDLPCVVPLFVMICHV